MPAPERKAEIGECSGSKPVGRKIVAHGASRGEAARSRSPGMGRKIAAAPSSAPCRGLFRARLIPTAHAVGYFLAPFGLARRPSHTAITAENAKPLYDSGVTTKPMIGAEI